MGQLCPQLVHPFVPESQGGTGALFQRAGLVPGNGQGISPHGGGQGLAHHGRMQRQPVGAVDAPDVQGDQGCCRVPCPVQGPAKQTDEARAPAFVSHLPHQHAAAGRIVAPRAQGAEDLPRDQNGGVAHLAVDIPQSQVRKARLRRQKHALPAV